MNPQIFINNIFFGFKIWTYAFNRFKIQLRVQDPSASVTLTLFDREARKLLGKSVDDILTANPEFVSFIFCIKIGYVLYVQKNSS